ncbi:rCG27424 [Rattus norvegicus]|uniref:RCG27424 n=1 Tax=Rattus norvegicus TaxID=10116 RepID=A6HMJ1_RAT|nr:rCG27424 [Rattus norvegicus]
MTNKTIHYPPQSTTNEPCFHKSILIGPTLCRPAHSGIPLVLLLSACSVVLSLPALLRTLSFWFLSYLLCL